MGEEGFDFRGSRLLFLGHGILLPFGRLRAGFAVALWGMMVYSMWEGRTRFSWLRPCYEVVTKNRNRGYAGMRDSVVSSRSGYDLVTLERNKVTTEAKSGIWILLLGNSAGYN